MSDTDLAFRTTLDASGFASGAQTLNSHLSTLGIQTNTASANLGGLGTILGTMANPATAAALAITSIGAGLATSVNVASDFQQKMAGVNAIVGGSAADMETLSNAAREAGATTQFSASQAADALGYMAGAGWNVQDSTAALKDTLMLAAAGGMDLAQAGDLMTNTVSQFGLAATDSARIANVLAAGASATNTSVSDLGAGMKQVGSLASTFGMSLEETTAALGQLSNNGIKGAEGGTALRGVLASLATQSGTAEAALSELGLTNADINPEFVSLSDSMQLLNERGMTATQAIAIFGRENVSAATYLARTSSELDPLQAKITGTGKASEMAATMTDTYQGAMGELSSAVEEAEIALGSVLLPVVTDFVKWATDATNAATNMGKAIYDGVGSAAESIVSSGQGASNWLSDITGGALGVDEMQSPEMQARLKAMGDSAATSTADGIKENKDLQTATGDTLGSEDSKKATKDAAKDSAEEFSKEWVQAFEIAQNDREIAKILARSATLSSKDTNEAIRSFDYLGEQFELSLKQHSGSAAGDYFEYSLYGGKTRLDSGQQMGYADSLALFEAITGLPAPEEGTEAYFRLIGKPAKAEQAKLQAELEKETTKFDYSGISAIFGQQFTNRLENEGDIIGKKGSDTAKDAYTTLLDDFRDPAVDKLGEVLDEINTLAAERPLAASEYQLFGEEYKAKLFAGISDLKPYLEDQMEDLAKQGTDAFSDSFLSGEEKKSFTAMKPWLEYLKQNVPSEFATAGGDSWLRFIEAIESGASSSDLEKIFGNMGSKAGESFAEALGMNMQNAVDSFDWTKLLDPDLTKELGYGFDAFAKNVFQEGELLKNAADNLELWNTGLPENREQVKQNIQVYIDLYNANKLLYTVEDRAAIQAYMDKQIDESNLLKELATDTEKVASKTADLADEEDDACEACNGLISAFGAWQEKTNQLWSESSGYVGTSYGIEYDWYMADKVANQVIQEVAQQKQLAAAKGQTLALTDEEQLKYTYAIMVHDQVSDATARDADTLSMFNQLMSGSAAQADTAAASMQSLSEAMASFDNKSMGTVTKTISFQEDTSGLVSNDVEAKLGLDTDPALQDFYDLKSVLEGETITAKLSSESSKESTSTGSSQSIASAISGQSRYLSQINGYASRLLTTTTSMSRNLYTAITNDTEQTLAQISTSTSNISTAISSAATSIDSAIWSAAWEIIDALGSVGGGGGGSSSYGSTSYSDADNTGGYWTGAGNYSGSFYYFSQGGYADRATLAIVGDSPGGEYMVPAQKLESFLTEAISARSASVGLSIDSSNLTNQLTEAIKNIAMPTLSVPLQIEFDTAAIREVIETQLTEAISNIKLRR